MFNTQLLNDVLMTVAFIVGLVIAISAWVVAASALNKRDERRTHIGAIEQHLANVAGQSRIPTR
jgi:ABC-type Co2+ transport system permease subunit